MDGLRETKWHALNPTANKWPSRDVSPGRFTPEPMASSLVFHFRPPPLWVLGGEGGLRRVHKDLSRSLWSMREDKGRESDNRAIMTLHREAMFYWFHSWGHPGRLSEAGHI